MHWMIRESIREISVNPELCDPYKHYRIIVFFRTLRFVIKCWAMALILSMFIGLIAFLITGDRNWIPNGTQHESSRQTSNKLHR